MIKIEIIDIPCPKCAAGKGAPCAKIGRLTAYGIVNLVNGPYFHMERWDAADGHLATRVFKDLTSANP